MTPGPPVQQPDATPLQTTGTGQIPLSSKLSPQAQQGLILPHLKSASLIAMGPLCDDDCNVIFSKKHMAVIKNNEVILRGKRNKYDDLWDIPIEKTIITPSNIGATQPHPALYAQLCKKNLAKTNLSKRPLSPINQRTERTKHTRTKKITFDINHISRNQCSHIVNQQLAMDTTSTGHKINLLPQQHKLAVIIRKKQTHQDLVQYLHGACFSPVKSTWIKAIRNNNFTTWPGLTESLVNQHLPLSTATVQGHLHRERQKLQSTTKKTTNKCIEAGLDLVEDEMTPSSPTPNVKTNQVAYILIDKKDLTTAYQDLTGRFPYRSSRGNEYILIGFHYDANSIIAHPVKNRKGPTLIQAWEHLHHTFGKAGVAPDVWILDNEISYDLKTAFDINNTKFQLVPPHSHRRNAAERAIQTWKNHFKAGLASAHPNFPLSEWDRLIPQSNITLNLLRTARANPALSAYAYIYGQFDFSATPLAPPGTKVVVHIDSKVRDTWELNGDVVRCL